MIALTGRASYTKLGALCGAELAKARFDTSRARLNQARGADQGVGTQGADLVLVGISTAGVVCPGAHRAARRPRSRTRIAPAVAMANREPHPRSPWNRRGVPNRSALSARDHPNHEVGAGHLANNKPRRPKPPSSLSEERQHGRLATENQPSYRLGERSGLAWRAVRSVAVHYGYGPRSNNTTIVIVP